MRGSPHHPRATRPPANLGTAALLLLLAVLVSCQDDVPSPSVAPPAPAASASPAPAESTGPPDVFLRVAETILASSGAERTTSFAYAVAWTQHTNGPQIIGCCALLQLLLGNFGRPGAGIMALRGHASIQGSTDVPTVIPRFTTTPLCGATTVTRRRGSPLCSIASISAGVM